MSPSTLFRLSGVSLGIGGLLAAIGTLPILVIGDDPAKSASAIIAGIRVLGALFIILGLPGMYLRQSERTGTLGLVGFALTLVAVLIQGVAGDAINALVAPTLAVRDPAIFNTPPAGLEAMFLVGGLLTFIGGLLLGIATLRAAVFSRWGGIALIAGSALSFVGSFLFPILGTVGVVLFQVGLAWLGIATASSSPAEQHAPLTTTARA